VTDGGRRDPRARPALPSTGHIESCSHLEQALLHANPKEKTMGHRLKRSLSGPAFVLIVAASVGATARGDDLGHKQAAPTRFAVTATEAGKQLRLFVPKSLAAGLVTITLMNRGKAFHEAQLIRIDQGH